MYADLYKRQKRGGSVEIRLKPLNKSSRMLIQTKLFTVVDVDIALGFLAANLNFIFAHFYIFDWSVGRSADSTHTFPHIPSYFAFAVLEI